MDSELFSEWRLQSEHLLAEAVGGASPYVRRFAEQVEHPQPSDVRAGLGMLRGALEDARAGVLTSLRTLVAAEVFTDFIGMARHLYEVGYSVPSASLAGAVLENGLRRIAESFDLAPRKRDDASALNRRLADANAYTRLVQRRLEVWIGIRNLADHGQFDEVVPEEVREMISGIEGFLADHLR